MSMCLDQDYHVVRKSNSLIFTPFLPFTFHRLPKKTNTTHKTNHGREKAPSAIRQAGCQGRFPQEVVG